MKKIIISAIAFIALFAPTENLSAATVVRRFLVAVGANRGSADRPPLRYAVSDAESFARLMEDMGGVSPSDALILREPTRKELQEALQAVRTRTAATHEKDVRYEVIFYYSGHANRKGLLLGQETLLYEIVRQWMDGLLADLRVAILDGCASGAITRLKGGRRQKAFMVDESSNMKGYAFLTSSTENESAQESERLKGSFFTYYLMAGMRGAADVSGDGKITINEAYQFAFQETTARTARTHGGTQHPAFDMNLTGTGDAVITDLRQTTARLVLNEELSGRLFIRTVDGQFVAELQKPSGRTIEVGLEPGSYILDLQQPAKVVTATVELKDNEMLALKTSSFSAVPTELTVLRGEPEPPPAPPASKPLLRRSRVELSGTVWPGSGVAGTASTVGASGITSSSQASGGGTFSYWYRLQPKMAVGLAISGGKAETRSSLGANGIYTNNSSMFSMTPAARFYPLKSAPSAAVNPFVAAGVGPYFAHEQSSSLSSGISSQVRTRAVVGGFIGGGLEFRIWSRMFLYTDVVYHKIAEFTGATGTALKRSGPSASFGIGFQFGNAVSGR